jgi:capsular exopolysaccharide synthesis family protein
MLIGALAGLLLGIVVASVRGRLDQRLRTVEQVEEAYGVDALGAVPIVREALFRRAAGLGDFVGLSPIAEAYRTIRTNLSLRQVATPDVRVILITSALPGEGKSAVAANLGAALASAGQRVLAVSGDVRSPALHEYFAEHAGDTGRGTTPEWLPAGGGARGLVDVLAGDVPVAEAIRRIQLPSTARWSGELMLLANDRAFVDASILYESRAMQHLLAWARDHFDAVVIDAPALLAGSESPILLRKADAVVLVGRLGRLDRAAVRRARQQLDSAGVTPAGVVVIGGSWTGEPFEARTHRRPGSRPSARGRAMRIAGGRRRPAAARGRDVG